VSNIMPVLKIQSGFKVRVPVSPRATVGIKDLNADGCGKLSASSRIPKRGYRKWSQLNPRAFD
jgi:hypothetical protein